MRILIIENPLNKGKTGDKMFHLETKEREKIIYSLC